MSEIFDEALSLICIYNLIFNRDSGRPLIDYKQFACELRKLYSLTNYESFTAGILDEILEIIEHDFTQRRSTWVADFTATLRKTLLLG